MAVNIDLLDKKILCELDENCRQTDAQIARKVRASRAVVGYRIKQLEDSGVIQGYITSINVGKLELSSFKIYFRLNNLSEQKEKQFFDYLKNKKEIIHVLKNDGYFDVSIVAVVHDFKELDDIVSGIKNIFFNIIKDYAITIITYSKIFKLRKFFLESKDYLKIQKYSGISSKVEIDENDVLVLRNISQDARMTFIELAKKTGLSLDIIRYRLKKLQEQGVITNFRVLVNGKALGYFQYVFLLKLKVTNKKDEEEIMKWAVERPEIIYVTKKIGDWDYEINVMINDINTYNKLIEDMKKRFSGILDSYNFILNSDVIKINYFPL